MDRGEFTLRQWVAIKEGSFEGSCVFRLTLANSAADILELVSGALDHIAQNLVQNRQYRQNLSEDQITIQVVEALGYLGFVTSHDAMIGGHCDISIKMDHGFIWLAEAKIWRGCSWAFKGLRQLNSRYATGLPNQNTGALILYNFQSNCLSAVKKWRKYLLRRTSLQLTVGQISALEFVTDHTHAGTGLPITVLHKFVPLHWDPQDA